MITTKTIYILVALLGLQFNTMFAAGNYSELPVMSKESVSIVNSVMLTPSTPAEATFEDLIESDELFSNFSALAPVIPMVADFSDGAPVSEINMISLAPVTPKEADFEDSTATVNTSVVMDLAPVTPARADFTDHI